MMSVFLSANRIELAQRCEIKVSERLGRSPTPLQLATGIPLLLDQLIRTLEIEQGQFPSDGLHVSGPPGGGNASSEVSVCAARHGKALLALGLTVGQVVHDYGDLCQAITDLAVERGTPFQVTEFRTLNRCIDNAISAAVTEFSFQHDQVQAEASMVQSNERIGGFGCELRNLLGTASLAFSAAKAGNLGLHGSTGNILERSLTGMEKLITSSVENARPTPSYQIEASTFSLAHFINEIHEAAAPAAQRYGCGFPDPQVDPDLALLGSEELLKAAVGNLLQNAFKFTEPGTEVILAAYAAGNRIMIDIQDRCGGLKSGVADTMFKPYPQFDDNRSAGGFGLAIARQSIAANGGTLSFTDMPGHGCTFSISLPRNHLLD